MHFRMPSIAIVLRCQSEDCMTIAWAGFFKILVITESEYVGICIFKVLNPHTHTLPSHSTLIVLGSFVGFVFFKSSLEKIFVLT